MATVDIKMASVLQNMIGAPKNIRAQGDTVGQVLEDMEKHYPRLKEQIIDEHGKLNPFILVIVNDKDIRSLNEFDTPLKDGDILSIFPAVAGG